ncbi:nucleotidyltransferase substrate binding protein [Salimicrobium halophilum]|uniref:Nucleotidyltransferase substrate binding protein, HI0074 family n=1 Tax=Salimicrobium halophilum TaxID=86666 RepID=A0A1G8R5K1_9BACI|nr:nucleotidyltransferase substrate binding protein [Salimicrobium halophilum]SDJ12239.1 nucleotidyltransferase substrate binding protein, HI0074 family [Salimicrobium halophilum]
MSEGKETRWRQRFDNFEKAYLILKENTEREIETDLERAGLVQLFEVAFELSWKVLKDYLESEGVLVRSPRETLKQAFQLGFIENGHVWMDALSDKNLTTHTYSRELTDKLIARIKKTYVPAMEEVYQMLKKEV